MQRTHTARSIFLALVVTCTIGALIVSSLGNPTVALAAGTLSGAVFRDFNANGIRDANDTGVGGVTVTAYDAAGIVRGSATSFNIYCISAGNPLPVCTAASTPTIGSYSLDATGTGPYRIEFSGWPSYLQTSAQGTNNGTSVQFVPDGSLTNVNFALQSPADYCGSNPRLVSVCFTVGDNTIAANSGREAIRYVNYNAAGLIGANPGTVVATAGQVGTIYGMAFDSTTQTLLGSAYVRRGAGLGPSNSTGTIYRVPLTGAPSVFLELNGLAGIDTGVNPHPNGATPNYITDPSTYPVVGKIGLGDLDLSEDGKTLYTVNLNQKELIILPIGNGLVAPTTAQVIRRPVPVPATCNGDGVNTPAASDLRPFALAYQDGELFLGMTCTAQSMLTAIAPAPTTIAELAAARAAMRAYIYRLDPATNTFDALPLLEFQLNYPRLQLNDNLTTAPTSDGEWLPWTDTWYPAYAPRNSGGSLFINPQPLLTDIEFDSAGLMALGFRDRFGDQSYAIDPGPAGGTNRNTRQGGDLLLACRSDSSTWVLESNGSCGTRTTTTLRANSGPGGGEFYSEERYNPFHEETALGGLSALPGSNEFISAIYDAQATFENGLAAFSNTTGLRNRAVQFYASNAAGRFSKATGLGDVELLCDQAPIEIGNRVWRDDDGDGVQDPGEPPLANVQVDLYRNAVRIGSATTSASGEYYFRSGTAATDANTADNIINDGGIGIRPRTGTVGGASEYEIRIPNSIGGMQQAALLNLIISPTNNDASLNGDSRDADGSPSGNDATYSIPYVDLDQAGSNNHTYDFGFVPADLGDLPDSSIVGTPDYNTTRAGSGPSHLITTTLRIGAILDGEPDGQPSVSANGDDSAGLLDDEDGVSLPIFELGTAQSVTVNVQNTTGSPATLYGFIDFNGDGTFDDLNEAVSIAVPNGTSGNLGLAFNVPAGANTTQSLGARFRLSTSAALGPNGPAPDGEVEDYLITVQPYSLGNRVWNDANNNGVIDGGEPGLLNVKVNLYYDANTDGTPDGASIADVLTDANGYYRFDNLIPSSYVVEVELPAGYASSTNGEEAAPNSNGDSNDNGTIGGLGTVRSGTVTLAAASEPLTEADLGPGDQGAPNAQANMTVDFGLFRTFSLGNRVWEDLDNSGTINAGEPGFNGVTVNLYRDSNNDGTPDGPAVATTSTDVNGYYRFDGLFADTYIVEVETPTNYTSSTNGQEADPDSDGDSNDNGTITAGGFTRSAPVTLNSTAIEPAGETELSPSGQGAPDAQANMTVDFGFFRAFSLGNRVWNDTDNSGLLEGAEAGFANVTVNLYRDTNNDGAPDGAAIAVATTDTDGYYRFDNLLADTYIVEAVTPAGYGSSTVNAGDPDLDADDSDDNGTVAVGANIRSTPVTLGSAAVPAEPLGEIDLISAQDVPDAQSNMTVDFGFFRLLSLGDYVWVDNNNNGLLDGSEAGIGGVTVELYIDTNANNSYDAGIDSFVASDITSADGIYGFSELLPGDYLVVLPASNFTAGGALVGYTSSTGGGSEPAPDVDADADDTDDNGNVVGTLGAGGLIASQGVTLSLGAEPTNDGDTDPYSNLSIDFGVFPLSSLGNFVWYDADGDGVQDVGENGVPGVTVTLFTGAGIQVISSLTDGSGAYGFTGLTPGDYYVVFSNLPVGHNFTAQNTPGDDALDSDANPATGQSQTVTLGPNEFIPTLDAGIFQAAGLGNYVWVDRDGDGVQDADEVGVPGVVVNLLDGAGNPVDGNLVTPGVQPVTTTTSSTGFYFFGGLVPANYQIEFVPPTGYFVTVQDTPSDDTLDSDASPLNGRSQVVTLGPGESNPTIDAGLVQLASLGNYVWEDRDRDGLQDVTEPGIPNVVVNLLNGNGTPVDGDPVTPGVQPVTTTTDAAGLYQFIGLIPGLPYQIQFVLPANYVFTGADRGGADDSGDSDADTNTGRTPVVTLLSGENNPTLDAGMYLPLSLGNLVWNDINNNGVVDVAEPGIANVSVQLYLDLDSDGLPDGASIATVTTDSNGSYLFENLAPGSYIVSITPPAGYIGSTGQNGSSGGPYEPGIGGNSDMNNADHGTTSGSQINSGSISLVGGGEPTSDGDGNADSNLTIDFGLFQPASLGSLVWNDTDLDGIFDPTEQGVPGVTVTLYDSNGAVIAVTVTSPNGSYQFDNLVPGVYQVGFSDLPPDTTFTPPNQGGNDGNDSDVDPTSGLTSPVTLVPGQNDLTIWAGIIPVQPTAISLYSFSAGWDGSAVLVRWSTTLELNTFGFRLLRSATGQLSDAIIVTPVLILGEGRGNGGADYSWRDKTAQPELAYSYWLEEVEMDGTTNLYGPASNGPQPSAGNYRIALPMIIR